MCMGSGLLRLLLPVVPVALLCLLLVASSFSFAADAAQLDVAANNASSSSNASNASNASKSAVSGQADPVGDISSSAEPRGADGTAGPWLSHGWTGPALGRPISQGAREALPQHVFPDGSGLPAGEGSASDGAALYAQQCASCHGSVGQGGRAIELVGDRSLLATEFPDKGIAVYWPYAATLFEYVYRSMPPEKPASLTHDQLYALIAHLLVLNELLPEGSMLDATILSQIEMPNKEGFFSMWRQ